jgi:hypothetical protein
MISTIIYDVKEVYLNNDELWRSGDLEEEYVEDG